MTPHNFGCSFLFFGLEKCFKPCQEESNDCSKFRSSVWTNANEATGRKCGCPHGPEVSEYCSGDSNRKP